MHEPEKLKYLPPMGGVEFSKEEYRQIFEEAKNKEEGTGGRWGKPRYESRWRPGHLL